jgi:hypothetical protein
VLGIPICFYGLSKFDLIYERSGIMNKKTLILFSLLVASLFLYGFEGKVLLGDYKTKNAEEKQIIEALISYEKAYNEHNLEGALSYCSETAKLRPTAEFVQVSKEDYMKRFPGQFYIFPTYAFYNPEIKEYGGKADLNLQLDTGNWTLDYEINMIKEKDKWIIQETSWENLRIK